jgi:hypothetical protein
MMIKFYASCTHFRPENNIGEYLVHGDGYFSCSAHNFRWLAFQFGW